MSSVSHFKVSLQMNALRVYSSCNWLYNAGGFYTNTVIATCETSNDYASCSWQSNNLAHTILSVCNAVKGGTCHKLTAYLRMPCIWRASFCFGCVFFSSISSCCCCLCVQAWIYIQHTGNTAGNYAFELMRTERLAPNRQRRNGNAFLLRILTIGHVRHA